jgi:hypothetical protein
VLETAPVVLGGTVPPCPVGASSRRSRRRRITIALNLIRRQCQSARVSAVATGPASKTRKGPQISICEFLPFPNHVLRYLAWVFAMTRRNLSAGNKCDPLDEPIVRIDPLILGLLAHRKTPEGRTAIWREADAWVIDQKIAKLVLLAQRHGFYGAKDSGWLLALRLAEERFDGFRVVDGPPKKARKVGRPLGSTKIGGIELVKAVESARRANDCGIKEACKILTRKGPWKNENQASLQTQYYVWLREAKAKMAKMKAFRADPLMRRLERAARDAVHASKKCPKDQATAVPNRDAMFRMAELGRSLL